MLQVPASQHFAVGFVIERQGGVADDLLGLDRVQVDMLLRQAAQPFGIVEVAPFGFQDMDGFDVFADVTVDAVQFLFQVLNPVFHNKGCENDGS